MRKIRHIDASERDLIALWKGEGKSNKDIAGKLGRNVSSIGREIKRNSFQGRYYISIHAQAKSGSRKSLAGKRHPLRNKEVFRWVIARLMRGWSPEQISGRMKLVFPNNPHMRICPETIYSFIYSDKYGERKFWEYLPWKRKIRKKKHGRKVHRSHIPERVSIRNRPNIVEDRTEFGHWEGDTIEGKGHRNGIHTGVERKSRFVCARKVERIDSPQAINAQKRIFSSLPAHARKTVTLDNGRENHFHTELRELGISTFFSDPYSSWQRGTNEHHNGLIRRYLPKKTDFSGLTQEELDDIVHEINTRPRKCLGFYTPREVFLRELNQGVAIQPRM